MCGCGVKDNIDVGVFRPFSEAVYAPMRGAYSQAACASQAIGIRINADHHAHFQVFRCAQHLNHQVSADIPRTYNSDGFFRAEHS